MRLTSNCTLSLRGVSLKAHDVAISPKLASTNETGDHFRAAIHVIYPCFFSHPWQTEVVSAWQIASDFRHTTHSVGYRSTNDGFVSRIKSSFFFLLQSLICFSREIAEYTLFVCSNHTSLCAWYFAVKLSGLRFVLCSVTRRRKSFVIPTYSIELNVLVIM